MQEKIWTVVEHDGGEILSVLAYDHESEAQSFARDMMTAGKAQYTVLATTIHRRHEAEEAIAHVEFPEFNTKCIECLVDTSSIPEEGQEAAVKFLEEHRGEIQKNAEEMVDQYIKKAITDFFAHDRIILG